MPAKFTPMLSASLPSAKYNAQDDASVLKDLHMLDWSQGFLLSPKIDGIRAIMHPERGLVSRTIKLIPNKHAQEMFTHHSCQWFDGELTLKPFDMLTDYNTNQSAIMTREGPAEIFYNVFDCLEEPNAAFHVRLANTLARVDSISKAYPKIQIRGIEHFLCRTPEEFMQYEEGCIKRGYEGVMIRHPSKPYKFNRSTFKEMGLIKVKRFEDGEAVITGFQELQRNRNEATIDERGYQVRGHSILNKQGADTLGVLEVRGLGGRWADTDFEMGSGLDDTMRDRIWGHRDWYLGKIVKYKFQPHGSQNKPRSPIFKGFRDPIDL